MRSSTGPFTRASIRPSSLGRAPRLSAVALAVGLIVLGVPGPAGAVVPPECTPDGSIFVVVDAPELAVAGPDLDVTLVVLDSCDEVDVDYSGTVRVDTAYIDESGNPGVQATFTPEDAGVLVVGVPMPREGLTYLLVSEVSGGPGIVGGTTVLAHGPQLYPVVEALEVSVTAGRYTASGITANPRDPGTPVVVSVRVDGTLVSSGVASDVAEEWVDAPPTVGDAHGFTRSVTVPSGTHVVCLYVDGVNVECRQATSATPVPRPTTPFGWFDGLYPSPNGLVASGWAIDPRHPDGTASISISSQVTQPGLSTPLPRNSSNPLPALLPRPDVAAAYPDFGAPHGFRTGGYGTPEGWTVQLCASVTGSTSLGCRSAVVRNNPLGALDAVTPVPGGASVRGWVVDLNTYASTTAHVYVDGRATAVLVADRTRDDVAAAFPPAPGGTVPGYGAAHGYEATVPLTAGRHDVCVYGIDVRGNAPESGSNTLLGCRQVVVASADPVGRVDAATPAPGGFTLRGWTADPDTPTAPLQVHTYRDGIGSAITTADQTRPDLAALDGGRYGTTHGFTTATIPTGPTARLCSYAINTGPGTNTTLACQVLTRPVAPTGALDEVTRTSPTTTTVRGWALDPDTAAPVDIHVYVDGRPAAITTATGTRSDIAAAYPGWGSAHGYSLTIPTAPGQRVCAYAINTLQGTSNTTLGCRTS